MKYYFIAFTHHCPTQKPSTQFKNLVTPLDPVNVANNFEMMSKPGGHVFTVLSWQEISKEDYLNFFDKKRLERVQDLKKFWQ